MGCLPKVSWTEIQVFCRDEASFPRPWQTPWTLCCYYSSFNLPIFSCILKRTAQKIQISFYIFSQNIQKIFADNAYHLLKSWSFSMFGLSASMVKLHLLQSTNFWPALETTFFHCVIVQLYLTLFHSFLIPDFHLYFMHRFVSFTS